MAKTVYDWERLKGEYIRGSILTVRDFLASKNIPISGNSDTMTVGWTKEREDYIKKEQEDTNNRAIQETSESVAQVRARQQKAAKLLQFKGLKGLEKTEVNDVNDARRFVVEGLREEREALDLNKHAPTIVGSVNIAVLNTRFGKMIQGLNYGQLRRVLERLSELDEGGEAGTGTASGVPDEPIEGKLLQE